MPTPKVGVSKRKNDQLNLLSTTSPASSGCLELEKSGNLDSSATAGSSNESVPGKNRYPRCHARRRNGVRQRSSRRSETVRPATVQIALLPGESFQVSVGRLELGMEACGERIHRTAVPVVGGVGDELVVEADARVG